MKAAWIVLVGLAWIAVAPVCMADAITVLSESYEVEGLIYDYATPNDPEDSYSATSTTSPVSGVAGEPTGNWYSGWWAASGASQAGVSVSFSAEAGGEVASATADASATASYSFTPNCTISTVDVWIDRRFGDIGLYIATLTLTDLTANEVILDEYFFDGTVDLYDVELVPTSTYHLSLDAIIGGSAGATSEHGYANMWIEFLPSGSCPNPIPEPSTLALLGLGAVGLGVVRRHRRRS